MPDFSLNNANFEATVLNMGYPCIKLLQANFSKGYGHAHEFKLEIFNDINIKPLGEVAFSIKQNPSALAKVIYINEVFEFDGTGKLIFKIKSLKEFDVQITR